MITHDTIEAAAFEIMARAAIDIPEDYLTGIKGMIDLSRFIFHALVSSLRLRDETASART